MFMHILILLICILASNIIGRFIPSLSIPIIQILIGALIAIVNSNFQFKIDPHTFLVMFIAPLLFCDGKKSDKQSLWKQRKDILLMALALVIMTVFFVGLLINKLIPSISLPAAFALAAALSPTDYVAVSALSKKVSLPKEVNHLIEGEGLMNDASGIVSFKFALAAAVTGTFSLSNATVNFFLVSIGGIAAGLILQYILIRLEVWITSLGMEDITVEMLLQILTPFIIYLIAEEVFKVSGILAVVVAGMEYSLSNKRKSIQNARLNEVSENTWSILVYILNGLLFVIVGLQLPDIIRTAFNEYSINNFLAIRDIFIITGALLLLRFIWVLVMYKFGDRQVKDHKSNIHVSILTALSGVRGAITLATVLSIPLTLDNGQEFPERTLILFLAVGVILITLLIATFILPIFAKKDSTAEKDHMKSLNIAQIKVWENTIGKLRLEDGEKKYINITIKEYNQRINKLKGGNSYYKNWDRNDKEEKKLMLLCYKKEIENTKRLLEEGKINEKLANAYEKAIKNKIKLLSLTERFSMNIKGLIGTILLILLNLRKIKIILREINRQRKNQDKFNILELSRLRVINAEYIIQYLKSISKTENEKIVHEMISYYNEVILLSSKALINKMNKHEKKKIDIKALQIERNAIQNLVETGDINWSIASELRKNLNYIESDILR